MNPRLRLVALGALALWGALTATACDRSRLTASHGRAYREVFARQIANPTAGTKPSQHNAGEGLDSQEAAIVSKTYRQNLAPKEDEATRGQMLYTAPRAAQSERAELPPPSVPERR
ncbi:MAG: hypothetical protein QOI66_4161 [Myxococcales bacterium]|jgi:hypothetical protein|nr:hypothetical protein [Myxococcales bacterium]